MIIISDRWVEIGEHARLALAMASSPSRTCSLRITSTLLIESSFRQRNRTANASKHSPANARHSEAAEGKFRFHSCYQKAADTARQVCRSGKPAGAIRDSTRIEWPSRVRRRSPPRSSVVINVQLHFRHTQHVIQYRFSTASATALASFASIALLSTALAENRCPKDVS